MSNLNTKRDAYNAVAYRIQVEREIAIELLLSLDLYYSDMR